MPLDEPILEELSAYLDGELDDESRSRVEERLARDAPYREEFQRLQRSWDMLDRLPRARVDDSFTRTTLQMVTVAAESEVKTAGISTPNRRRGVQLAVAAGLVLAVMLGFAMGRQWWPDPNQALLKDLPLVEHLDELHHADSLKFLQMLQQEKIFALPDSASAAAPLPAAAVPPAQDNLAACRQRLTEMSIEDQQLLLKKWERFQALPAADQDNLRQLHSDLAALPSRAQLEQTLASYNDWLRTLSPGTRAELVSLASQPRIERIKQLRQEQEKAKRPTVGGSLTEADMQRIAAWMEDFIWRHKEQFTAGMPDQRRQQFEQLDEATRRRSMLWLALQKMNTSTLQNLPVPEDLPRLVEQLSPQAKDALKNAEDKRRLMQEWIHAAVQHRAETQGLGRMMPLVSQEELDRFFEKGLSKQERDRLLDLPREQMQRELRRLYLLDLKGTEAKAPWLRPPIPGEFQPRRPMNQPGKPGERPPMRPGVKPDGSGNRIENKLRNEKELSPLNSPPIRTPQTDGAP